MPVTLNQLFKLVGLQQRIRYWNNTNLYLNYSFPICKADIINHNLQIIIHLFNVFSKDYYSKVLKMQTTFTLLSIGLIIRKITYTFSWKKSVIFFV